MSKLHQRGAFIFRRDLRLEDNLGLLTLLEAAEEVLPIFIFDPKQVDRSQNEYFSEPAFAFLLNSLAELNRDLEARGSKLHVFHADPTDVVRSLITNDAVETVHVNKDYTPFARTRDKAIADICDEAGVTFVRHNDLTLSPIEDIRTGLGKLYTVFTPFMKNAASYEVPTPRKNNFDNYFSDTLHTKTILLSDMSAEVGDRELILRGGRDEALSILREPQYLKKYGDRRNIPSDHGTSRLSAHHKFGTISIRETYETVKGYQGNTDAFTSELYWRDFYCYISYHFPIVFKKSFLPWAKHIDWINKKDQFTAWCAGATGVPMVDAAMRELNHTGWMHNRSRMIVASYLTKNLLIDWRWGERYFATQLIDYDPAANNGGWQWSASTGADPRPIRIFNPYTQATKFDPDAEYIQKWVPELKDVEVKKLTDGKTQDFSTLTADYPAPIEDQKSSYHRTMATYKAAKEKWRAEQPADKS